MDYPTLETERLILRPFDPADASEVQRLAGEREVAHGTLNIPHPYEDGMAEQWIASHRATFEAGGAVNFAIVRREDRQLVGSICLMDISGRHQHAEIGYWIGKLFWGNGFATEAARAVLGYAFEVLQLNRVFAFHYSRNPSSGRVLEKVGFIREGGPRKHVEKWGIFEDLDYYGILREEWESR
jgi:RimJ/RimL family protein N-acetyltransferase